MSKDTFRWIPKPGIYQSVLTDGDIHIDVFIEGRAAEPVAVKPGQEIELYERELRPLRRSEILQMGLMAPLRYFEKDEEGKQVEVEAEMDCGNPNVISDDNILLKVQQFPDSKSFGEHINKITSTLTLRRFHYACELLDTPQSFIEVVLKRLTEIEKMEREGMYVGPIDEKRKSFLSAKIER